MNTELIKWRCANCGISSSASETECSGCGGFRVDRNLNKNQDNSRLLSTLSNSGNENVQNNVNNVSVQGNVNLGNYFDQSDDDDEYDTQAVQTAPARSFFMSFFMVTCAIAMWMAIFGMTSIFAFFVWVFVKASFAASAGL